MQVKGRYLILGWTAVFLAVTFAIVLRAHRGFAVQKRVGALGDSVLAARSTRDKLKQSIAGLRGRTLLLQRLGPTGLRDASDSEVVSLHLSSDH